jgi:hypothetical protein
MADTMSAHSADIVSATTATCAKLLESICATPAYPENFVAQNFTFS